MSAPDPSTAPPRPDLIFLRHRSRRRPPANPVLSDFIAGHATHPHHPAAAAPATGAASASGSVSGSLDLSDAPAPPSPAAAPPRPAARASATSEQVTRRIAAGAQQLLSVKEPTVTLTRVQSGVGQLEIEAVCSAEVGDLRLGAAYQLADGTSSTVQYTGGNRFAPSSRRPVILAGRDEYENLRVDLRQSRSLVRMAVYAFSESRAELRWGGTLVLTTFGAARVELPLETLFAGRVAVLMSIYNFDGEYVVRAEMETITGDVREAARAYGYDRITWRDDRTPVD
jgi:uncharacterized protein involved in tellurium resistance